MSILSQQKQSQNTDFPNVRPSLDLRFALAKKLDPRITFTRGSIATYVGPDGLIKTAGANQPRFDHDPISGECKGLLIEENESNSLTYSEDFTQWTQNNSNISSNSTISPDGTLTDDSLTDNYNNSTHYISKNASISAGSNITFSVFFKFYSSNRILSLELTDAPSGGSNYSNVKINPSGQLSSSSSQFLNTTYTITPFLNGWYRLTLSITTSTVTTITSRIALYNNINGAQFYSGDGSSGVYIWGAQLEASPFATSYIPTTTATVTRSIDSADITGTNFSSWYNQSEGSIFCRYDRIGFGIANVSSSTTFWALLYTSSSSYMVLVNGFAAPASRRFDIVNSGTISAQFVLSSTETSNVFYRSAVSYKENNINASFNGRSITSDKICTIPIVNRLNIGRLSNVNTTVSGHISRLTYYPIQLTNQQLINLTS